MLPTSQTLKKLDYWSLLADLKKKRFIHFTVETVDLINNEAAYWDTVDAF